MCSCCATRQPHTYERCSSPHTSFVLCYMQRVVFPNQENAVIIKIKKYRKFNNLIDSILLELKALGVSIFNLV